MSGINDSKPARWSLIALLAGTIASVCLILGLLSSGESTGAALRVTSLGQVPHLFAPIRNDSWQPMALAEQRHLQNPDGDLYDIFFVDRIKFQYPPSALLILDLLPGSLYEGPASVQAGTSLTAWLSNISRIAFLLTACVSILLFLKQSYGSIERATFTRRETYIVAVLGLLLAVTFYPLVKSYQLGQVQVFLGALIALALFFYVSNARAWAGFCLGLCCLVKPQYGLVLLWALFRREHRFALGWAAAALGGGLTSLAAFGLADHLRYLDVLRDISWHGEAYWPNQTVNGLINRLLGNGSAVQFWGHFFAPYHPLVYYSTLLTSFVFMALALWPYFLMDKGQGRVEDLSMILVAATIASPVAWEHHYGAFFPILAACAPAIMRARPFGNAAGPLLLSSYVLIASVLQRPDLLFVNRWTGLLGSHLFIGAVLLFVLLLVTRAKESEAYGVAGPFKWLRRFAPQLRASFVR